MKQRICNNLILIAGSVVLGLLLLFLVHLLPTEKMQENVYWAKDTILAEFDDEWMIDGYDATMTGSFTDSLMLGNAIYKSEEHSALEQSLRMYRAESCPAEEGEDAWWPGHSLIDYMDHVEDMREVQYPRYWHGYLVILKPLLMLTSLNGIRMLNGITMMLLLGAVVMLCGKQNKMGLGVAFLAAMPFLFFSTTFSSLSLSICYYIAMSAVLALLLMKRKTREMYAMELFLVTGIATAYFDLLTYPLVTLGFPLCAYLYLRDAKGAANVGEIIENPSGEKITSARKHYGVGSLANLKMTGFCILAWGIGYGVMWAFKWILSDVLTGSRVIADAFATIFSRAASAEGGRFAGYGEVLSNNLKPFSNMSFGILVLAILACLVWMFCRNLQNKKQGNAKEANPKNCLGSIKNNIVYLLIAGLPFVWWFVLQNHSEEHWAYTCRIFAVTVLALVAGAMRVFGKDEA